MPTAASNTTLKATSRISLRPALFNASEGLLPRVAGASALLLLFVVLYWPTFTALIRSWIDFPTYSHGWLVTPIAAWLVYKSVPALTKSSRRGSGLCALGVIGVLALWVVGYATDIASFQYLALPTTLWLLAGCRWGIGALRVLLVPYATLLLVAPIWEPLVIVLQPTAVKLVEFTTRLIGLQVFVQGNLVMIPAGSFSILDACSGLRYVVAAVVVALLAGELAGLSRQMRISLVIGTVLAAIFLNHLRIVTIILVGYYEGLHHPLMGDHAIVGEIYFAVFVLAPTVFIARLYGMVEHERRPTATRSTSAASSRAQRPLLLAAMLTAVVPLATRAWDVQRLDGVAIEIQLPDPAAGWSADAAPLPWNTRFSGAAGERARRYTEPSGAEVRVYVASFLAENDRQELIGQESGLAEISTDLGFTESGMELPSRVNVRQIKDRTGRLWRTWSWYQIGEEVVADRRSGKIQKLKSWFRRAAPASVLALAAPCMATCDNTTEDMRTFLMLHGDDLVRSVIATHDQENTK